MVYKDEYISRKFISMKYNTQEGFPCSHDLMLSQAFVLIL